MKKRTMFAAFAVLFALAALLQAPRAAAQEEKSDKAGVKIGDKAPPWKELEGGDGKRHGLGDLREAKAVLVVFTCNHCPVAQAYEDRIIALDKDYRDKGVTIVAINVNNIEADKLPAMKKRAEKKGFKFAYLYDPSQKIGRAYGASVTPHAFLLDLKRNVAYIGAIDDDMDAEKATAHYVRDALDAVLAGKNPETAETRPSGCGIQYE